MAPDTPKADKTVVTFAQLSAALKNFVFPELGCVVGIARGGMVPAALIAHQLGLPLHYIRMNYRDDSNQPRHDDPVLLEPLPDGIGASGTLLLVDDVSVSGKTFQAARSLLPGRHIITFALKGRADLVLLPDIRTCVIWPWSSRTGG